MTGTTPYQVRRATAGDTNALADIATRTFALACPPDTLQQDIDDFTRAHLSAAAFAAYLAEPERHLFILESAGGTLDASGGATGPTTIGYAMTIYGEPAESSIRGHLPTGNLLELSKFYIDPGHHQRGAAQALAGSPRQVVHRSAGLHQLRGALGRLAQAPQDLLHSQEPGPNRGA